MVFYGRKRGNKMSLDQKKTKFFKSTKNEATALSLLDRKPQSVHLFKRDHNFAAGLVTLTILPMSPPKHKREEVFLKTYFIIGFFFFTNSFFIISVLLPASYVNSCPSEFTVNWSRCIFNQKNIT